MLTILTLIKPSLVHLDPHRHLSAASPLALLISLYLVLVFFASVALSQSQNSAILYAVAILFATRVHSSRLSAMTGCAAVGLSLIGVLDNQPPLYLASLQTFALTIVAYLGVRVTQEREREALKEAQIISGLFNPLTVILGYSQLLSQSKAPLSQKQQRMVLTIAAATKQAVNVVVRQAKHNSYAGTGKRGSLRHLVDPSPWECDHG